VAGLNIVSHTFMLSFLGADSEVAPPNNSFPDSERGEGEGERASHGGCLNNCASRPREGYFVAM
jgi:hypothetical protein